jgi:hypothetical protein
MRAIFVPARVLTNIVISAHLGNSGHPSERRRGNEEMEFDKGLDPAHPCQRNAYRQFLKRVIYIYGSRLLSVFPMSFLHVVKRNAFWI